MTLEEQWKLDKWGKFSASKISLLCEVATAKEGGGMFGKGAMTYIKQIARQAYTLYNERDNGQSLAMKNGIIDEPQAFQHLYRLLGIPDLFYYGGGAPRFFHYNEDSGCSPDVMAMKSDGVPSFGADLKCPTGDVYFDYLDNVDKCMSDEYDLRIKKFDEWAQLQFSMMTMSAYFNHPVDLWLWCAYNEYFPMDKRMIIIEVKADKKWQQNMDIRLQQAIIIKYEEIAKRKNRHLLNQN